MRNSKKQIEYCNTLKIKRKKTYKDIGRIRCPILNKDITFNSIGFRHLLYKQDGTARNVNEVIYKLTLLPLAIPTIKNAIHISDIRDTKIRYGRGGKKKVKRGRTYSLVAKVGRKNPVSIRVIVLSIENGNFVFYSIMKD